jgi:hypothetical protein
MPVLASPRAAHIVICGVDDGSASNVACSSARASVAAGAQRGGEQRRRSVTRPRVTYTVLLRRLGFLHRSGGDCRELYASLRGEVARLLGCKELAVLLACPVAKRAALSPPATRHPTRTHSRPHHAAAALAAVVPRGLPDPARFRYWVDYQALSSPESAALAERALQALGGVRTGAPGAAAGGPRALPVPRHQQRPPYQAPPAAQVSLMHCVPHR